MPHLARGRLAGPDDLRWQLAFCLLLGPVLMLAADILARSLRAPAELLTGVVVAFIGAFPAGRATPRPEGGSMSMPPAHDACGAMRARPVHAAPILRAGRWLAVLMLPRALAYGAALILLMLLSVALALTLGAQGLSWRELPTVLGGGTPVQQWLAYTCGCCARWPRWARRWACRARCSKA